MSTLSQRLDLRQSQNLVMTPQLQQAIRLLQLGNMELAEFIESEIAQNPLLEKEDGDGADDAPADSTAAESGPDDVRDEFDEAWTGNESQDAAPAQQDFDSGSAAASSPGAGGSLSFDDPDQSFENRMSRGKTLREHLEEQFHCAFPDPRDRMIGALLIDLVDESGYIRDGQEELAARLGCAPERVGQLLARMRQFSPTGICAGNLKDCLAAQLEERGQLDAPMKALLENLDLLAAHDFRALSQKCGVNETYLRDMVAEIRALNPRPAAEFDHLVVQTAVPDVLMKRLPREQGGGWRVELNADTLPKVLVNNSYYAEVAGKATAQSDRKYLDEQLQAANWLVRALDQRAKTIVKVASRIVEHQEAFFLYGVEFLRPLVLREIAEATGLHESTVSRVTSNKYIGTPRGLFELKYFFSASLGEGGDAHAAEAVKARIKTMIDSENPQDVLSDDRIVEILKKDGIDIARRTVAKYREALRIPSSVQRRREKKDR